MEKEKVNRDCCSKKEKNVNGFWRGIVFAIIPHSFCILFVIFSIIGATFATQFLRQFLMLPFFVPILIGLSLLFASISAFFYLKRIGKLSLSGAKEKKNYLFILFSTTIVVNVLFFYFVMPMIGGIKPLAETKKDASVEFNSPVTAFSKEVGNDNVSDDAKVVLGVVSSPKTVSKIESIKTFDISVDIPCSGHAFLITGDLEKLNGVKGVEFYSTNKFKISYDSSLITKEEILDVDIFKTYKSVEI